MVVHKTRSAVLGLAKALAMPPSPHGLPTRDLPRTMVDRIVPAGDRRDATTVAWSVLGVYDPCAIACEPFRQWGHRR